MKKLLLSLIFTAITWLTPNMAQAACAGLPYVFVPLTQLADANQVNANFNTVRSCATNIDASQVGSNGIYANQIIPTNSAQATFGSTQDYIFGHNLIIDGNTTIGGNVIIDGTLNTPFIANTPLFEGSPDFFHTQAVGCGTVNWFSSSSGPLVGVTPNAFGAFCNSPALTLLSLDSVGDFAVAGSINTAAAVNAGTVGTTTVNTTTTNSTNITSSSLAVNQCVNTNGSKQLVSSGELCPQTYVGGSRLPGSIVQANTLINQSASATSCNAGVTVTLSPTYSVASAPLVSISNGPISGVTAQVGNNNGTTFKVYLCNTTASPVAGVSITWFIVGN